MTNLLSLEAFRKILAIHPYHFWGWEDNNLVKVSSACNSITTQYAWQNENAAGRFEIAKAIEIAERKLFDYLGYEVAPRYKVKTLLYPKYFVTDNWRWGSVGADGRRVAVSLGEKFVQSVGTELRTLIGTGTPVISDANGDTVNDKFTLTMATTETDTTKIQVFIAAAHRYYALSDSRVLPIEVAITGGNVTVTGPAWAIGKPTLYEGLGRSTLDPAMASNYANLEIYTVSTYTEGQTVDNAQATLLWETLPCDWWPCCYPFQVPTYTPNASDPAGVGKAIARCGIRDSEGGLVIPAQSIYDATTSQWTDRLWPAYREPDRVIIRYQAGYALDSIGEIDYHLKVATARLAAAELSERICACDVANQELSRWQWDAAWANRYVIRKPTNSQKSNSILASFLARLASR